MAPAGGPAYLRSWQAVLLCIVLMLVFVMFLHGCSGSGLMPWNWCDDDGKRNNNNNFNNNFNNNNFNNNNFNNNTT